MFATSSPNHLNFGDGLFLHMNEKPKTLPTSGVNLRQYKEEGRKGRTKYWRCRRKEPFTTREIHTTHKVCDIFKKSKFFMKFSVYWSSGRVRVIYSGAEHPAESWLRTIATINPYKPRASAKMRIKIIPTNSPFSCALARVPLSPTIPMAIPAPRPERPQERPAAKWAYPSKRPYAEADIFPLRITATIKP